MAVATTIGGCYLPSKFHHFLPTLPKAVAQLKFDAAPPPIFISSKLSSVDLHHLQDLCSICNHSCHRFPAIDRNGRVEPVNIRKLRIALSHSFVIVSVFTKPEFVGPQPCVSSETVKSIGIGGDWIRRVAPVSPENGQLIGFGRAVSDVGLTASIHDVMVHPTLQGWGIDKKIVQRIIRMLINRDIYEISVLCNDKERLVFRECGFRDDEMGSTTMMYTSSNVSYSSDAQTVLAGRKQLVVPPPREVANL